MKETENKELVREQFTRTAEVFGEYAVAARGAEARKLAEMVGAGKGDRAIDTACGAGALTLPLARRVRWACGVDLTPAILSRAKKAAAKQQLSNLDFALGDAQRLPFADNSLDLAVTSYALHHMPDARRAISEMARVVRRGGRVGVIDIYVPGDQAVAEMNDRIERARDASHTRTLSRREFEEIFEANGLRVSRIDLEEDSRSFDHWLHVAGWHPGDRAYEQTRRLMETTMQNDAAGFHPRYQASPGAQEELLMTSSMLLIAAEKA